MSEKLNREQLEAMGLTPEQIDAILGATQDDGGSSSLPFPKAVVNLDPSEGVYGGLCINPEKNDDGLTVCEKCTDLTYEMRLLTTYFQYLEWDSNSNKYKVISDIKKGLAKKSDFKDINTGLPVTEVGGDDLTFYTIALVEINGEPVVRQMRGKYAYLFNEEMKKQGGGKLSKVFKVKHKKNVNGSVIYFTPEFEDVKDFDYLKTIKDDADKIAEMDKWVDSQNARGGSTQTQQSVSEQSVPEVDVDEESIPF